MSIVSIIRRKERNRAAIDFTLDYHAHILPGCDHGSDSLETSQKQIAMAKAAGIKTICATPHFYPNRDTTHSFLLRRQLSYEKLSPYLVKSDPQILLGAEVLICDAIENMDELYSLCLEGTNELLIEMPFYKWPSSIWATIYHLNDREDIRPVIAHAERYPAENIELLIREGISLQLNVDCLLKPFKRKRYFSWIENGYVAYLGSDIHMTGANYQDWIKCKIAVNAFCSR